MCKTKRGQFWSAPYPTATVVVVGGRVYSSYSLATDLKSQMTFGLGCHIGWIHEWKKIIVEILKMMTSCLDKSAVGLECLTGYFSGMD